MTKEDLIVKDSFIKWKDNSEWSIWVETVKNHTLEYVVEYQKYDDIYMLRIMIDNETYEDINFSSIDNAKLFAFAYSTWFYWWLDLVANKMKYVLDL